MAGALVYAGLTFLISPKATLLIQTFMPLVMLLTFVFVLGKPGSVLPSESSNGTRDAHVQVSQPPLYSKIDQSAEETVPLLGNVKKEKLQFINKKEAGKYCLFLEDDCC